MPALAIPEAMRVRFVFPHAPKMPVAINNGYVMPAWYDIREAESLRARRHRRGDALAGQLEALMARETARGVDDARIVLAGFSQGGAVALYTGLRHPRRIAGIVALSTYLIGVKASTPKLRRPTATCPSSWRTERTIPSCSSRWAQASREALVRGRVERRVARVPDGALRRDGGGGRGRRVPSPRPGLNHATAHSVTASGP